MVEIICIYKKEVTHTRRRIKRAAEFAPPDVRATIPSEAEAAERERQAMRDRYAAMQTEIGACTSAEQLKAIIDREGL